MKRFKFNNAMLGMSSLKPPQPKKVFSRKPPPLYASHKGGNGFHGFLMKTLFFSRLPEYPRQGLFLIALLNLRLGLGTNLQS